MIRLNQFRDFREAVETSDYEACHAFLDELQSHAITTDRIARFVGWIAQRTAAARGFPSETGERLTRLRSLRLDRHGNPQRCAVTGGLMIVAGSDEIRPRGFARLDADDTFTCDACGDWYEDSEYDFDGVCVSCMESRREAEREAECEEEERDSRDLLSYGANVLNYTPKMNQFLIAKSEQRTSNTLYLGVELEVVARGYISEALENLNEFSRHAIFTHDGSLPSKGFEIVSTPMTLAAHKQIWREHFFSTNPKTFLSAWPHDSCGMHVHLSRAALSPLTLGKMLVFLNAPKNRDFVERIAGRSQNKYCESEPKKFGDARKNDSNRYQALNLATYKPTVELRIFRANVAESGFFKNLEFAHALVRFCENQSAQSLTPNEFCAFVSRKENASTYEHLRAFLGRAGLIHVKKPSPRKAEFTPNTSEALQCA